MHLRYAIEISLKIEWSLEFQINYESIFICPCLSTTGTGSRCERAEEVERREKKKRRRVVEEKAADGGPFYYS
jgi:hypothetical protein